MEQGNCLDSTPVSGRQVDSGVRNDVPELELTVTALLTRPTASTAGTATPLPEPGSDEAKALFRAACTETDRLDRDAVHGYPMLKRTDIEWWTKQSLTQALETGAMAAVEYANLYPLAAEREHRIDAAAITTNVAVLHALAYAEEYSTAADTPADAAGNEADADLLALTQSFDAAHSAWLEAAAANDEPHKRCSDHLKAAMARGVPAIQASEAAWSLPGVMAANYLEDSTHTAVCDLAQKALRMRPQTLAGLALQARAVIPLVWVGGNYDADASLGVDEDLDKEAVRNLIESVLTLARTGTVSTRGEDDPFADPDKIPGFMPMPVSKPTCFMNISLAIPLEGKRLLDIAQSEFERRLPAYAGFPTAERAEHIERLRVTYRLDALQALAEPSERSCARTQPPKSNDAVRQAIDAHRKSSAAFLSAALPSAPMHVRQAGRGASAKLRASLDAAREAARTADEKAWRDVFCARPSTLSGLLSVMRHTAEHYDTYAGMKNAPDVFAALIAAVEGLCFAMQPRPADYDLSQLSIAELEQLARITNRERETLMAVENQGFCWTDDSRSLSEIGKIVEAEGERMAFLGDHAVHEIEHRQPTVQNDINLRLEALVRHDLNCNGYVEPDLLAEVVQAWGRA